MTILGVGYPWTVVLVVGTLAAVDVLLGLVARRIEQVNRTAKEGQ